MENIKIHKIYVNDTCSLNISDSEREFKIEFRDYTGNKPKKAKLIDMRNLYDETILKLHTLNPEYMFNKKDIQINDNGTIFTFEFMELPKINKEFMGVKLNIVEYKVLMELKNFAMNNRIFTGVDVEEVMEKYLLRKGKTIK